MVQGGKIQLQFAKCVRLRDISCSYAFSLNKNDDLPPRSIGEKKNQRNKRKKDIEKLLRGGPDRQLRHTSPGALYTCVAKCIACLEHVAAMASGVWLLCGSL